MSLSEEAGRKEALTLKSPPPWFDSLDSPRPLPLVLGISTFALYLTLLGFGIFHHEPWFDEAQAWLLARDASLGELIFHYLRYEGSPGLWHLLLSPFAKGDFPYATLSVLSGSFACLGILLFLWLAPFPWPLKILYPFTYFVLYQYAVVARSYALLAPILWGLAQLHARRRLYLGAYIALLAVLAQLSLHGLIIAGCIAAWNLFISWRARDPELWSARNLCAYGILLASGLLAVWQLRLPTDHQFVSAPRSYDLLRVLGAGFDYWSRATLENRIGGAVLLTLSLLHFYRTEVLGYFLLPMIVLSHLFGLAYGNFWHEGIVFLLWIFVVWLSVTSDKAAKGHFLRHLLYMGMLLTFSVQIYWTARALNQDYKHPYSAAEAVAQYIKARGLDKRRMVATGFHAAAVLPYFDRNIFTRDPKAKAFWDWSLKNSSPRTIAEIQQENPDVIIWGIKSRFSEEAPPIVGYTALKFEGHLYWKDRILEEDSYVIYEKIKISSSP